MSVAPSIAIPSPRRRGACPTLEGPMQTGDGLLARLRLADSQLSPTQLGAIAKLAALHGNGQVEITARGNLQVRGLTTASTAPFAAAVRAIATIEQGLVVETPPLAGDDPTEL
ncbi:MAG TPA: precorrin-3B synthase, partial [Devosia sp.]|nr:precorrin-3B synthase [Devosia sp.]